MAKKNEEPGAGHNSVGAGDQLKTIIERIERLEEEKATIAGDVKEIYAEAKGNGFDVAILRKVIARRKRDRDELKEEEALIELYESKIGIFG